MDCGRGQASRSDCNVEGQKVCNVMFLCSEWKSSKGGLPTFNREFAVNLAKYSKNGNIKVHCYVCQSDELDREDARSKGVNLITAPAQSVPGSSDPLDCLKIPPPELPHPDIVIGHGRKFGTPAFFIVRAANCKWMHFVHVFCEDLGKYKLTESGAEDAIELNEKKHKSEIELCKAADVVVAVGSRLQHKYSRSLPGLKVEIITPGILEKFSSESTQLAKVVKKFNVFMFGRAAFEDLTLKGYDIVANAIGSLGKKFELTFVGSPTGEHRKIEQWFLDNTRISRNQVTIRSYCNQQDELKMMFRESDLVALPSRTEGFGLVALEAISAGIPVLVTDESGIAEALEQVEGGDSVIVESNNAEEWAKRIQHISSQSPEERQSNAMQLRENYKKMYSWSTECEKFKRMIQDLMELPQSTCSINDSCESVDVLEERPGTYFADKKAESDKGCVPQANSAWSNGEMTTSKSLADLKHMLSGSCDKEEGNQEAKNPSVENKGWNSLHSASQGGDVAIIETMLSLGLDINSRANFGTTPLMVAAASGNVQAVHYLLSKGADPSLTTKEGRNLLHAAAQGGNTSIMETMLSCDLDINSSDNDEVTSLMIATFCNHEEVVDYLLGKGADPFLKSKKGRNVLFFASNYDRVAIIKRLLSLGFKTDQRDDEGNTLLMHATASGKKQTVDYLLEQGADPLLHGQNGWSLLHFASQGGNIPIIETMLSKGLDIDSGHKCALGITPLMIAIVNNKVEATNYLLDKGADPSIQSSSGLNSLHVASMHGNLAMIDAILSHGLDIDINDNYAGHTSLMLAAVAKLETVNFLLHKSADPFLTDNYGMTFLHHASLGGNIMIIEKALSCKLDIESTDSDGKTPLMTAAAAGNADAVKYLVKRGAKA